MKACALLLMMLGLQPCMAVCLGYGKSVLTGKLIRETFAGPPNYESIAGGDQRETYFFLSHISPFCVEKGKRDRDYEPAVKNINVVQLVLEGEFDYSHLRSWLGKTITCTGNLFHQETGHHYSRVLMSEVECSETSTRMTSD